MKRRNTEFKYCLLNTSVGRATSSIICYCILMKLHLKLLEIIDIVFMILEVKNLIKFKNNFFEVVEPSCAT